MRLSLVITTYNNPQMLELIFLSLLKQKITAIVNTDIEILIADDGSTGETKALIDQYENILPFKINHIWHEDNGFRAAAIKNLAVSKSNGNYIVLIDGDCILPDDFLNNQVLLAEENYFVAGNRVLLSQEYTHSILKSKDISITSKSAVGYILSKFKKQTNKFLVSLRLPFNAKWRKFRQDNWKFPKGCNIGVWKSDYLAVNGFDETFSGWGHEDADFFIRLLHLGVKIKDGRFSVPVFHMWHKENDRSKERQNWQRLMDRFRDKQFIQAIDGIKKYKN